jgi:hypothetical protein
VSSIYYLMYIARKGISFYLFIFFMIDIIKGKKYPITGDKYPRKLLSAYFIICILMVSIIEINELITKTVILIEMINPFYAFYVLDFTKKKFSRSSMQHIPSALNICVLSSIRTSTIIAAH